MADPREPFTPATPEVEAILQEAVDAPKPDGFLDEPRPIDDDV